MWTVRRANLPERDLAVLKIKRGFEELSGQIPGLVHIEVGVDRSKVDYACDLVLYSVFESEEALQAYATHPAHFSLRQSIEGLRVTRHQVDYETTMVGL